MLFHRWQNAAQNRNCDKLLGYWNFLDGRIHCETKLTFHDIEIERMNNINMSAITNISRCFASGKHSHAMLKRSLELSDEAYRSALNEMRERIATSDIGVTILEAKPKYPSPIRYRETVQTVLKETCPANSRSRLWKRLR